MRDLAKNAVWVGLCLMFGVSAVSGLAQKGSGGIVEKRNVPLAMTVFVPEKPHEVKAHWRLAFHRLTITPFVAESFDHTSVTLGMQVKTGTSWPAFTVARIVLTADGKVLGSFLHDWRVGTSWAGETEQTTMEDSDLLHKIAASKEIYLTVLFARVAPFDQMNFRLSTEQLGDCRLLVAKYDALKNSSMKDR
jgi:hypothetical protein